MSGFTDINRTLRENNGKVGEEDKDLRTDDIDVGTIEVGTIEIGKENLEKNKPEDSREERD